MPAVILYKTVVENEMLEMATQDVKITATITVTNCSMLSIEHNGGIVASSQYNVRVALSTVSFRFILALALSLYITLIHAGKLPLHKAIVSNEIFSRHCRTASCSQSYKHSNIQSIAIFRLPPPPAKSFEQRFLLSNLSTYHKVDAIARLKCKQNDTR